MSALVKHLIDLVGGLPNALCGVVEGLIITAYLAVVYLAACAIIPFN